MREPLEQRKGMEGKLGHNTTVKTGGKWDSVNVQVERDDREVLWGGVREHTRYMRLVSAFAVN